MTDDLTRRGPSANPYAQPDHFTRTVEDAAEYERRRADPRARWINGMPRDPDEPFGLDEALERHG